MTELATYQDLIRALYPRLAGGIRWGLERTERLLEAAGDPHRDFPVIHIAGTNGKGSVAAILATTLREHGLRVGLYTSPHLCTFRERVQIDGRPIGEREMLATARGLWPAIRRDEPSFFEATTAIAFRALADAGVDIGIIEVGLGGRLDATNVVSPELAIITNVSIDHTNFLGETIEAVAREKAGIIKRDTPVLTGAANPRVRAVLQAHAAATDAPFHTIDNGVLTDVRVSPAGTGFRVCTHRWGELDLRTPLVGWHQAHNAALALRALEMLPPEHRPRAEAVARGVEGVAWPGRMQLESVHGQRWIFDVAHNPAGAEALAATLETLAPPRPLVLLAATLADKDWRGMIRPLLGLADHVVLTLPPSMPEHRRWDPVAAGAALAAPAVQVEPEFGRALERTRWLAAGGSDGGSVVVTGSFHTVGDALAVLGRAPFGTDTPLPAAAFPA